MSYLGLFSIRILNLLVSFVSSTITHVKAYFPPQELLVKVPNLRQDLIHINIFLDLSYTRDKKIKQQKMVSR